MKKLFSLLKWYIGYGTKQPEAGTGAPDMPYEAEKAFRSSLYRYFRYNEPDLEYVIEYDPVFEAVMDRLRREGWQVQLKCNRYGGLFFIISTGIQSEDHHNYPKKQHK